MPDTITYSRGRTLTRRILCVVVATALLAGCAARADFERLAQVYGGGGGPKNPVIWIPGILGSELTDSASGEIVWGGPDRLGIDPIEHPAARVLAVPLLGEGDRAPLDSLRPTASIRRAHPNLAGLVLDQIVYGDAIRGLEAGGYRFDHDDADHATARLGFEFAYDWRRDIVEAAQQLGRFIDAQKAEIEQSRRAWFGDRAEPVRFDLVTHSMGGLVARYYLMYGAADLPEDNALPELTWAGARNVGKVIYVAPPNTGSVNALAVLVNGREFGPLQPVFEPVVLATYLSIFEMLPRPGEVSVTIRGEADPPDLYDAAIWDRLGMGIMRRARDSELANLMPGAGDAEARRTQAKRHLARALRRARAFQRAIDRPEPYPSGLESFIVAGSGRATPSQVTYHPTTGRLDVTGLGDGDVRVLVDSALGGPAVDDVLILPAEHLKIVSDPAFIDQMLRWLRGDGLSQ